MRLTLVALFVIPLWIVPAPALALARMPPQPIRVIRFERPAGFSIPDALAGVGAASLLIALTALLAAHRPHG